jgi:hypothetical protein
MSPFRAISRIDEYTSRIASPMATIRSNGGCPSASTPASRSSEPAPQAQGQGAWPERATRFAISRNKQAACQHCVANVAAESQMACEAYDRIEIVQFPASRCLAERSVSVLRQALQGHAAGGT